MNDVSFMEKFLDGVEIEWKPLGEVIKLEKGRQLNKELLTENGLYPAYNGGISHSGFTDSYNHAENTIIVSQGGASAGFVNFVTSKFYANAHCYIVLPIIEIVQNRYIYHFLELNQEKLTNKQHGAGIPALRARELKAIQTPIPCPDTPEKSLAIQAEIVRILDTFTTHTAELTAELTAREKQYNYYRDQLLTFEDGQVEWKTLGEIGEFIRGNGIQKKDFVETGFPAIHYGQIFTRYGLSADKTFTYISDELSKKSRIADKNNLLIATTSENDTDLLKPVAWLGEKAAISGDMLLFRHNQNVKYLAYYFQTEAFQKQKIKYITGEKVRRVSGGNLERMTIPIPHLAEQARTVDILDKFDALTNSISEGLPREIKLRQQQYEYYRDLLLSFPKPETTA